MKGPTVTFGDSNRIERTYTDVRSIERTDDGALRVLYCDTPGTVEEAVLPPGYKVTDLEVRA